MAKKAIPMLSQEGYTTSPKQVLTNMTSHAFRARHNDDNLFGGNVTSVQILVGKFSGEPYRLAQELELALTTYYGRAFDRVEVSITVEEQNQSIYHLNLDVVCTKDNETVSLGSSLSVDPTTGGSQLIGDINA